MQDIKAAVGEHQRAQQGCNPRGEFTGSAQLLLKDGNSIHLIQKFEQFDHALYTYSDTACLRPGKFLGYYPCEQYIEIETCRIHMHHTIEFP